jgi:hypothetical protein
VAGDLIAADARSVTVTTRWANGNDMRLAYVVGEHLPHVGERSPDGCHGQVADEDDDSEGVPGAQVLWLIAAGPCRCGATARQRFVERRNAKRAKDAVVAALDAASARNRAMLGRDRRRATG